MSRPFNTDTRLGQLIEARGWTAGDFAVAAGVNARTLTEYLARRRKITREHLYAMADLLGVEAEEIDE